MSTHNADSDVKGFLQQLKKDKREKERRKGKEQRFTVTLSEFDYRRLRYIANELGLNKSALVRQLLIQALNDAEKVFGLEEIDSDLEQSTGYKEYTRYGLFINGEIDEPDDSDED